LKDGKYLVQALAVIFISIVVVYVVSTLTESDGGVKGGIVEDLAYFGAAIFGAAKLSQNGGENNE